MNDGLVTILAGLLGSIITIIVTKALEIFQKTSEYKEDLKKQYFLKKLQAGETAMIQFTHISASLKQLSVLYLEHNKLESGISKSFKENFLQQINDKLTTINSSSLLLSSSINLYFDFKNKSFESNVLTIITNKISVFSNFVDSANHAYGIYMKADGIREENQAWTKYIVEYDNVLLAAKDIGVFFEECDNVIQEQMEQMRNEMRKYE